MTNPNDPAFSPCSVGAVPDPGLTKREHFAALAMQGILSSQEFKLLMDRKDKNIDSIIQYSISYCAQCAVDCAEALISELNKEPKP